MYIDVKILIQLISHPMPFVLRPEDKDKDSWPRFLYNFISKFDGPTLQGVLPQMYGKDYGHKVHNNLDRDAKINQQKYMNIKCGRSNPRRMPVLPHSPRTPSNLATQ